MSLIADDHTVELRKCLLLQSCHFIHQKSVNLSVQDGWNWYTTAVGRLWVIHLLDTKSLVTCNIEAFQRKLREYRYPQSTFQGFALFACVNKCLSPVSRVFSNAYYFHVPSGFIKNHGHNVILIIFVFTHQPIHIGLYI